MKKITTTFVKSLAIATLFASLSFGQSPDRRNAPEENEKWALDGFNKLMVACSKKPTKKLAKTFSAAYDDMGLDGFQRLRSLGDKRVLQLGEENQRPSFFISLTRDLWPQNLPDKLTGVQLDRECWESFNDALSAARDGNRKAAKNAQASWVACKRTQLSGNSGKSLPPSLLRLNQCLSRLLNF